MPAPGRLDLLTFIPFRLNRLAATFSEALAADYARFGIDIPEWRVLATLGQQDDPCTAQYVVTCTHTHKSRISRAVAHLVELELVVRGGSRKKKRQILLKLSPRGRAVYEQLVPLMLAGERRATACLSEDEIRTLAEILGKLETHFRLKESAGPGDANALRQAS